jgi:hypothetical protein
MDIPSLRGFTFDLGWTFGPKASIFGRLATIKEDSCFGLMHFYRL